MSELRKLAQERLDEKLREYKLNKMIYIMQKRQNLEKKIEDLEEEIKKVEELERLPEE